MYSKYQHVRAVHVKGIIAEVFFETTRNTIETTKAIQFCLPKEVTTDSLTRSYNGFPVSTTDDLVNYLDVIAKSGAKVEKPTALEQFFESYPICR